MNRKTSLSLKLNIAVISIVIYRCLVSEGVLRSQLRTNTSVSLVYHQKEEHYAKKLYIYLTYNAILGKQTYNILEDCMSTQKIILMPYMRRKPLLKTSESFKSLDKYLLFKGTLRLYGMKVFLKIISFLAPLLCVCRCVSVGH